MYANISCNAQMMASFIQSMHGTGEWTGLHFWIEPDKDCPIDVKVEFR